MEVAVGIINLKLWNNELSIIRTAEHFGVRRVYIVGKRIKDRDKKWGQVKNCQRNLKIKYFETEKDFVKFIKQADYKLILIEKEANSKNIYHYKFPDKCVIMSGNESRGFTDYLLKSADDIVHIPNVGMIKCMNTSVAFGIGIYKYFEQKVLD